MAEENKKESIKYNRLVFGLNFGIGGGALTDVLNGVFSHDETKTTVGTNFVYSNSR